MRPVVGVGPAFVVDRFTNSWSADASVDVEPVSWGDTIVSIVIDIHRLDVSSTIVVARVGVGLTRADCLNLAAALNDLALHKGTPE